MPLDGCPRCGYPFEREPGYFLLSIFAINYGVGALIGLVIYLVLDFCLHLPIWLVLTLTIVPMPIFNLLFARHSKALFLAFDLFLIRTAVKMMTAIGRSNLPRRLRKLPIWSRSANLE